MRRDNDGITLGTLFVKSPGASKAYISKKYKSPIKSRRKNVHVFQLCYADLCSLHNIPMIFPIKSHLHERMLDFNGDRVKLDEWRPILKALSLDRTLHLVAIRSKTSHSKVLEQIDSETKSRKVARLPVLLTSFIFKRLISSISCCLNYNSHLKCLELDGLLLSGNYLECLMSGLEKSSSLQHLSLHRCPLGDDGCQLVCRTLRNLPNILTVDMSGCNISAKGASFIAKTLQYQNLNRYGENWKQSLRYRIPETEEMPGLRRVTLNHNPLIGDIGVEHIICVLRDDLWLKALDLQNVGLTNDGGMEVLDMLSINTSLSVLDVRNNNDVDKTLFESIMNVLAHNNLGKVPEYHWIQEDTLYLPRRRSYQSRDPSSTHRSLRVLETMNNETNPVSRGVKPVRVSKSNVIPTEKKNQSLLSKRAQSASAVTVPYPKELNGDLHNTVGHHFEKKERSDTRQFSTWECLNAAGDASNLPDMSRARLRELSSNLEEEKRKRIQAEIQKEDLERKLKIFTEDSNEPHEHVLVEKRVIQEIAEAFALFNGFLTIFNERGLQLESSDSSEAFSGVSLSSVTSSSSDLKSLCQIDKPEGVSHQINGLPSLSSNSGRAKSLQDIHDVLSLRNRDSDITASNLGQTNSLQGESVKAKAEQSLEKNLQLTFSEGDGKKCQEKQEQEMLDQISLKLKETLTHISKCKRNSDRNFPVGSNTKTSQNDRESYKSENAGSFSSSKESLYINAQQGDRLKGDVSSRSWTTMICSSDSSATATLTDLNS